MRISRELLTRAGLLEDVHPGYVYPRYVRDDDPTAVAGLRWRRLNAPDKNDAAVSQDCGRRKERPGCWHPGPRAAVDVKCRRPSWKWARASPSVVASRQQPAIPEEVKIGRRARHVMRSSERVGCWVVDRGVDRASRKSFLCNEYSPVTEEHRPHGAVEARNARGDPPEGA